MKAVFTISSKNYLPRAFTLFDSIKKYNPDLNFYIFLADEKDENIDITKCPILEFREIEPIIYRDMGFKYNVIEFNTSIKPFCFKYLFNKNYNEVLYFDPDCYVYNDLNIIFDMLEGKSIVLTPHFFTLEVDYSGGFTDKELLHFGINNLGFVAIKNDEIGNNIIQWWGKRLRDQCFGELYDGGLFVDQKWMEFIPYFYSDACLVSRNLGLNVSGWNLHERQLVEKNGKFYVFNRITKKEKNELIFVHYSGFNPHNPEKLHSRQNKYNLDNLPEYKAITLKYANHLISNGFDECIDLPYAYAHYENGIIITNYQRRFYKELVERYQMNFVNPFSCKEGTFYDLLLKNKLVDEIKEDDSANYDAITKKSYKGFIKKDKILRCCMAFLKNILGHINTFYY